MRSKKFDINKQNIHKRVKGVSIQNQTVENIITTIGGQTEPELYPIVKVFNVLNKDIILLYIDESNDKPVSAYGRFYKRVGNVTKHMSRNEFERLFLERKEKDFDSAICQGADYKNIDQKAVKNYIKQYEKLSGNKVKGEAKSFLQSLNCIKFVEGKVRVTNAGILLFGKNIEEYFPKYYVSVARYAGKDIGIGYLDLKDFKGNLFELIDSTEKYIQEHIETLYRLKEGQVAREAILQYPKYVIRELIVNAVAHRDYSIRGSKTLIKIFKDRIEFDSPGGFAGGVNENNILYQQYSRNPTIVRVLNKIRYIEEIGEGWNRVVNELRNYPLNSPLPSVKGDVRVAVTLFSPDLELESELTQFKDISLNERQQRALAFLRLYGKIKVSNYTKVCSCQRKTALRDLNELLAKKLIKRVGARGKYVYYTMILNETSNVPSNETSNVPSQKKEKMNNEDEQ